MRLHLLQQFKTCSASFSTTEKSQSPSKYLIILVQMRFRVKTGVQGSSQKKCKKKRKEKNQESHLNVQLHTQNDNPRFFCCTSSKSCEISLHYIVGARMSGLRNRSQNSFTLNTFVHREYYFQIEFHTQKNVAISRHYWKVSLCETACRGEMQVQRDEGGSWWCSWKGRDADSGMLSAQVHIYIYIYLGVKFVTSLA